ncbi:MAG: transcription antitermination factor NusB [Bacteroidaceae bacterium]|nr:transcription antitermination factor NusB [Bacteroidaceae bacterium]
MINRDLIRTKIVQLTYAYYVNGNDDQTNAEKELLFSLSKAHDLYLFMLHFIVSIRDEAEYLWTVNSNRLQREGGEKTSRNFIDNKFILQLKNNSQLNELIEKKKMTWEEDKEVVHKVLQLIEQSEQYKLYQEKPLTTYEDDRNLWKYIYKTIISTNDDIDDAIEELSLYWNDDRFVVDTFVLKTIKRFEEKNGSAQPLLDEYRNVDDKNFAINLFRNAIDNCEEYRGYMQSVSQNWDISRLSTMDIVLLQLAIAEMLTFPEIAVQVTINEFIDLAKMYSTPKSSGYINGMLDTIARMLHEKGLMLKPVGRKNL